MKKVISTEKAPAAPTIFTGNRSKWYGLYIRHYPGCTGDRRDSGGVCGSGETGTYQSF